MDCPVCSTAVIVVEREGIELDYCLTCKGLWFDADELELLAEALKIDTPLPDIASLPKAQTAERSRKCPRCGKRMEKVAMGEPSPVVIDRCPRGHGLWFDAGELGQVVGRHGSGGKAEGQPVIRFLGEVLSGAGE